MAKRHARRVHHHLTHHKAQTGENYLVVVRSWMFVVAFALMLGLGAMVGQFISAQIAASTPVVAGVTIQP
ncbi:MAG: hypothetical protein NT149_01650 [Candidatus Gottesmanbacteria bacterium]|nr:hypothetical protein [Candidatus Gottesmanbacteria bacterium]